MWGQRLAGKGGVAGTMGNGGFSWGHQPVSDKTTPDTPALQSAAHKKFHFLAIILFLPRYLLVC